MRGQIGEHRNRTPQRARGNGPIERIRILERDIHSHSTTPDALRLQLTMSNTADHEQPYPLIQLSLYDDTNRLVAQRKFSPTEYMASHRPVDELMPTELPVQVEMDLADPGDKVTGFRFDFL